MNYNKIFILLFLLIENCLVAQQFSFDVKSALKKGTAYVNLGNNNNNFISRPFIIIEGFDPDDRMGNQDIFIQMVYNPDPRQVSDNLLIQLQQRGYDIIVFNINNTHRSILENAELVARLIKDVNNRMVASGSINRTVVAGISMGGLTAKAALRMLENEGYDHRCDLYISLDSPHRGANVPLGFQHMYDHWKTGVGNFFKTVAQVNSNLNMKTYIDKWYLPDIGPFLTATSATEMAHVYYLQNYRRLNYLTEMAAIGFYPEKCRKLALSNGTNAVGQGFKAGAKLLDWTPGICLLDNKVISGVTLKYCPLALQLQVNAMPGDLIQRVYMADMGTQVSVGNTNLDKNYFERYSFQRDYLNPIIDRSLLESDNAPGGYYRLSAFKQMEDYFKSKRIDVDLEYSYKDKYCYKNIITGKRKCHNVTIKIDIPIIHANLNEVVGHLSSVSDYKFCFVPTTSALDINTYNYFYNVKELDSYPYPKKHDKCPFDAVCFSTVGNTYHSYISDANMARFVMEEVAPETRYIQNRTFKDAYTNIFEANNIVAGYQVDPVPNRTNPGNVDMQAGTHIELRARKGGKVTLKPGFKSSGHFVAAIDRDRDPFRSYNPSQVTLKSMEAPEASVQLKSTSAGTVIGEPTISYSTESHRENSESSSFFNEPEECELSMVVTPQPVVDQCYLYISRCDEQPIVLSVYSSAGILLEKRQLRSADSELVLTNLEMQDYPSGIYLLTIQSGNHLIKERISKK